jgi:hypothetical protein
MIPGSTCSWVDEHGHMLSLEVDVHTGFPFPFLFPRDYTRLQRTEFRGLVCISKCEMYSFFLLFFPGFIVIVSSTGCFV